MRRIMCRTAICLAGLSAAIFLFSAVSLRAQIFPFPDPIWSAVAPMSLPRVFATATKLADNRVLVLGGFPGPKIGGEIFSPLTSTWSPAAPMSIGRAGHVAVLLQDGRVLVAGGRTDEGPDNRAELYDPRTNTWWAIPPMTEARSFASAVTLEDGRVMVAGGGDGTAEIYDPGTNSWTAAGRFDVSPRFMVGMAYLDSGRVLVAGGQTGPPGFGRASQSFSIYQPHDNSWISNSMRRARADAAFTVLADGRVMAFGGVGASEWTDGEIFDPLLNTWVTLTPPTGNVGGYNPSISVRPDGRVLAFGGALGGAVSNASALYDPATNTWAAAASMNSPRYQAMTVRIPGGRSMVIGGTTTFDTFTPIVGAELFGFYNLPFPNAGPDQTINGCATCLSPATLDASGTIDNDGDILTYTWKEGSTTLAVTSDPVKVVTVGFGLGTHTITLTVTDGGGAVATDNVVIVVRDVTADISLQLVQCRADLASLEAELTTGMSAVERDFRQEFGDGQFVIPGGSPGAQLQNLLSAINAMSRGQKRALYRALGGQQ